MLHNEQKQAQQIFSGNIYVFHAFDVGEEINLDGIQESNLVIPQILKLPKYFKNYHIPLAIELPNHHLTPLCSGVKIHNFGSISLTYKIPFKDTLHNLRQSLVDIDNKFQEQSVLDANSLFKLIRGFISKPNFFSTRSSYLVIQVDTEPEKIGTITLKDEYGSIIASALRFETKTLSEYQKNEILESAIGYFRGDLIVIDTEAAFIYDAEYQEILDLFEFSNIQLLELRYFDRVLDHQLTSLYEEKARKVPLKSYLPFIGTLTKGPVDELGKLKVDVSVITERLEDSIKLVGEPYFLELYTLLNEKLGLNMWKESIDKKLSIIHDVRSVIQNKVDAIREDMLTVLIIILIFIELIIGMLNYFHKTH